LHKNEVNSDAVSNVAIFTQTHFLWNKYITRWHGSAIRARQSIIRTTSKVNGKTWNSTPAIRKVVNRWSPKFARVIVF